jgi:hypothetical protein
MHSYGGGQPIESAPVADKIYLHLKEQSNFEIE